jgi:predicted transposase YbfD/YdcC
MKLTLPTTELRTRELDIVVFDPKGLLERLKKLRDRRGERGKRYELAPLLLFVVFAKLSGEDTPSGIADWVANRAKPFIQALHLDWARTPHHTTLRRIIAFVIDPDELDRVVAEHLTSLSEVGTSRLVAFDGKTVRGTISEANPQGEHLLAAYLPREGLVLGQVAVQDKENELVEAPKLLGQVDLRDKVVVADAMHAQRELSKQVKQAGGEFIWLIKENQPTVLEEIEELFAPQTPTVLGGVIPNDFVSYDATFHEDRTRQTLGHAGHVMAALNNLAIGLLRRAGFCNIAQARRACDALFNPTTYLSLERLLT